MAQPIGFRRPKDLNGRTFFLDPALVKENRVIGDIGGEPHVVIAGTLDTKGEDDRDGDTIAVVACYLRELETPDYVIQHIDSTRSLDGQQTEEWDGIKARWTYHPDRGLIITLVDTEA